MELSDQELYRQMRKGNQRAFAALYDRREPALYRYALHMSGSRAMAEEVAHEVFLRLAGPNPNFDANRGSLEGYLYGMARNTIRAMRRKNGPAPPGDDGAERRFDHDMLGDLIRDEAAAALYAALDELPERYRDAVALCDLEEKSYEDAARLMECPVGTVRSRLHRARALLSEKLRPEHASSGAASRGLRTEARSR